MNEEGRAGRGYMKEGRLVGESVHGVREGVNEEGRAQREINEGGEAGRGEHGVRGGRGCWREGRRREGGRQGDKGRTGRRGRKEGRTGGRETPMLSARHGYAQACQWLLAFTLY